MFHWIAVFEGRGTGKGEVDIQWSVRCFGGVVGCAISGTEGVGYFSRGQEWDGGGGEGEGCGGECAGWGGMEGGGGVGRVFFSLKLVRLGGKYKGREVILRLITWSSYRLSCHTFLTSS